MAAGSGGDHYEAEVSKGSIHMVVLTGKLNMRWKDGWRLDHVFEQQGNTVMVWARRDLARKPDAAGPTGT